MDALAVGAAADPAVIHSRARAALDQHRVRILWLGAGLLVAVAALFFVANLMRGYPAPNPALLTMVACGLGAFALHFFTGRLLPSQMLVIAAMVGGTLGLTFATGDFVRVLPWWGFFVVYTVATFEGPRAVVAAGLGFSGAGAVAAFLVPTDKIPHQLVLAVVVPAATTAVAGFKTVARRRLVNQWLDALADLKTLRGILPICMYCRRLRDDAGSWLDVEHYVAQRVDVSFVRELCHDCGRQEDDSEGVPDGQPAPRPCVGERDLSEESRRGLFVLTVSLTLALSAFLIGLNLVRRNWEPVVPLLLLLLMAAAVAIAYRRGLALGGALRTMLALLVVGVSAVGLVTHDFLRVFVWWPFLIFFAVAVLDRLRAILYTVAGLTVWSALLAFYIPGAGIPNLLLSAVLVPVVTSAVAIHDSMARRRLLEELVRARTEVRRLQGVLPICAGCKQLREDDGAWRRLEAYIEQRSRATFSHGVCNDCESRLPGGSCLADDSLH